MKRTDLAYVAGIIDGEGYIGLTRQGKSRSIRLTVSVDNTNEWLIQWLHFAFGGSIYLRHRRKENWKPQWSWIITCLRASDFLKLVYPFLRIKKPQAEIAIKFQEARRGHYMTDEERVIAEAKRIIMKGLNQRGIGSAVEPSSLNK